MAVPATRFRQIPNSTAGTAVNTAVKRLAAIAEEREVSTGSGNELRFGIADISTSAGNSDVVTLLWDVTANGGNTIVNTFRIWLAVNGFNEVASVLKMQPLSGADQLTPSNTENYVGSATVGSYTWATMPGVDPGVINVWPADEGASMDISGGASDDAIMVALYAAVAAGETTGFYLGLTTNYELRFNWMFIYS